MSFPSKENLNTKITKYTANVNDWAENRNRLSLHFGVLAIRCCLFYYNFFASLTKFKTDNWGFLVRFIVGCLTLGKTHVLHTFSTDKNWDTYIILLRFFFSLSFFFLILKSKSLQIKRKSPEFKETLSSDWVSTWHWNSTEFNSLLQTRSSYCEVQKHSWQNTSQAHAAKHKQELDNSCDPPSLQADYWTHLPAQLEV